MLPAPETCIEDAVIDELGDFCWRIGTTRKPSYDLDVCDEVLSQLGQKHEASTPLSDLACQTLLYVDVEP